MEAKPARVANFQNLFLNALRKERVPVLIYLVNGIKLHRKIDSFDSYVMMLKNGVIQIVYKHAISTILPIRPISYAVDATD